MPEGALRLADLGFFDLELLRVVGEGGGHWLSRLKVGTVVSDPITGERMDLLALVGGKKKSRMGVDETLELSVLVGDKARFCRRGFL